MKINLKESKGITLIALVITIIVLLILAGVAISTLTGDNGILKKAQSAKTETDKATIKEQIELAVLNSRMNDKLDASIDEGILEEGLRTCEITEITKTTNNEENTTLPWIVTVNGVEIQIKDNGTVEEYNIFDFDKDTQTIKGLKEGVTLEDNLELIIPAKIGGVDVKKINNEAFKSNTKIKKVTIADGIKEIGQGCFNGCSNIEEAKLAKGMEKIGSGIFKGCMKLETIYVPQRAVITDSISNETQETNEDAYSLYTILFRENVGESYDISQYSLKEIVCLDDVTSFGIHLGGLVKLEKITFLADSLEMDGPGIFGGTNNLNSVKVKNETVKNSIIAAFNTSGKQNTEIITIIQ